MRALVLALALCAAAMFAQEREAKAGHDKAGHGEAQAEHGDSTTMWKWANFAILAALIGYFAAKSAGPFFSGRSAQIQNALVEARTIKEDADARASGIDRRMANLGADIEAMKTEAREEMAAEMGRIQAETDKLLAKIRGHAHREIESAEKQAIAELRAHASELALGLAARKIRSRMTAPAQDTLVDQFVRRLERPKGSLN